MAKLPSEPPENTTKPEPPRAPPSPRLNADHWAHMQSDPMFIAPEHPDAIGRREARFHAMPDELKEAVRQDHTCNELYLAFRHGALGYMEFIEGLAVALYRR